MGELFIGLNTDRSGNWFDKLLSWLIRKFTGGNYSHAWLLHKSNDYKTNLIIHATSGGVKVVEADKVLKRWKFWKLFKYAPKGLENALPSMAKYLGNDYDYGALIFFSWVIIAKNWFKKKVKNPWRDPKAMICSEFVTILLQKANVQGAGLLDPETTSPKDLDTFLTQHKDFYTVTKEVVNNREHTS